MADGNKVGAFASGVGQNMAASIVASAVGGLCFTWGFAEKDKLEDPSNWPLWLALFGGLFLLGGAANALRLWAKRKWAREMIEKPPTDRIGILIAALEDDSASHSVRKNIADSLRRELGYAADIKVWPESLRLPDNAAQLDERAAERKAQQWLTEKGCDVLIWGRVKRDDLVVMRFTAAEGSTSGGATHQLDERLELKAETISELGTVIAARVVQLAAAAVDDAGKWLVPVLRTVTEKLEALTNRFPETMEPQTKSTIFGAFGNCQSVLGEQSGDSKFLAKAIVAYESALEGFPRNAVPLQWAATQNNLGAALQKLGTRENGTARLEEAVAAYGEALKERTRERVPLQWAMTQNNLGNALQKLGDRENSTARLDEAVAAYGEALKERTRERVPLQWAMTQNNLGNALQTLGERENSTARLDEAVAAYGEALKEYTRERVPLDWATTQNNLGNALQKLAERENSTARLDEAVAAYGEALKERIRERVPLQWAMTQVNMAQTHEALFDKTGKRDELELALDLAEQALEVFSGGGAGHYLAMAERVKARILGKIACWAASNRLPLKP